MKIVLAIGISLIFIGSINLYFETQNQHLKKVEKTKNVVKKKDIKKMSVAEKKAYFIQSVYPAIKKVYLELEILHEDITKLVQEDPTNQKLQKLQKKYKVKNNEDLLKALKPHPISITLAQAAMESAWGTSRFYQEANNIFGVWSFNKNEPRIAAGETRGAKTIYVKKYSNYEDAVRGYYLTIGRVFAFDEFRELRLKSDDPYTLVEKLDRYSERGAEYGKELKSMISYNNFTKYDLTNNKEMKYVQND